MAEDNCLVRHEMFKKQKVKWLSRAYCLVRVESKLDLHAGFSIAAGALGSGLGIFSHPNSKFLA